MLRILDPSITWRSYKPCSWMSPHFSIHILLYKVGIVVLPILSFSWTHRFMRYDAFISSVCDASIYILYSVKNLTPLDKEHSTFKRSFIHIWSTGLTLSIPGPISIQSFW